MGKTPLNLCEDRFLKIIYAENNKFYPVRKLNDNESYNQEQDISTNSLLNCC